MYTCSKDFFELRNALLLAPVLNLVDANISLSTLLTMQCYFSHFWDLKLQGSCQFLHPRKSQKPKQREKKDGKGNNVHLCIQRICRVRNAKLYTCLTTKKFPLVDLSPSLHDINQKWYNCLFY